MKKENEELWRLEKEYPEKKNIIEIIYKINAIDGCEIDENIRMIEYFLNKK